MIYEMTEFIFSFSIAAIVYAYFGYPVVLCIVAFWKRCLKFTASGEPSERGIPSVTVIITVRNEERVIRDKLLNTLALKYPPGAESNQFEIIVASDASDDQTTEIVREYSATGVKLVALAARGGKERAQAEALGHATGEIIVFTDARSSLPPEALSRLVAYFSDPRVGAVSSVDRVTTSASGSSGEGLYVIYEMWLRRLESACHSLIGLSGSCFAVRKVVCSPFLTNVPSDFQFLINARKQGFIGIHAEDATCSYESVKTEEAEFTRKVRTVLRGIHTLFSYKEMLNPFRFGFFSIQLLSHKLCRWLVPFFILLAGGSLFILSRSSFGYTALFFIGIVFFLLAAIGYFRPALRRNLLLKVPLFFTVSNLAILSAWIKYLSGERTVKWDPSQR